MTTEVSDLASLPHKCVCDVTAGGQMCSGIRGTAGAIEVNTFFLFFLQQSRPVQGFL